MVGGKRIRLRAPRWQFNIFELILISGFAAFLVWGILTLSIPREARALAQAYGPSRNSENYEEWMIRDFFRDRRGGLFLDVGANHYRTHSNTYYLETTLGWSGIAVEPLRAFEADYRTHRPRTRFRAFFASDVSHRDAKIYLLTGGNHLVTSADQAFTKRYGAGVEEVSVPSITLTDLLDAEGVAQIDFMSMDIELHEPRALAGFDIERFRPELVCIEAHPEVRQPIIDYFTQHRYAIVGKYLRADELNLYFTPLAPPH